MNQTKYYNLFKLYQGTYLSNLKYLNKNMDIIDEALHNASPSSAGVQDVKVDGISVVTNHIANVDLTSYAKTADLVYKQDKLTAGANINIDGNNVISATDTTYTAGTGITIENNVISATGGAGLQYWHETATRFYREGTHEGISGLENYLKQSTNEVGHWQSGNGWSRCMVTRLKGNPRNVIMGYAYDNVDRHPIITYASTDPLDFEWGWSADTFYSPYGVTTWADKDTYPVPREGHDWYFGWSMGTVTYEGETWYVLLIDTYTWAGGTAISSEDGITMFTHAWENNPQDVGLTLLETANAVPYITVVTEIGTQNYAFKYGGDDKTFTSIDTDGNALFKEITTDAGTLTSQMAAKQDNIIAGTNIIIGADGKTINATDTNTDELSEMTDVSLTSLADGDILKYDATNQEWVNAQESGGTEVVANPSGSASATLNKVAIDNVIYSLPSGGGGGGGSFVGLTKSQYDALPTSEKEDTSKLYLVQEGGGETDVPIDMSGGTVNQEYNMSITPSQDKVTSVWNSGSSIGGQYFTTPIDLTDITKLKWTVKTTTCYGHNNSNVEEQTNANWQLTVGIVQSIPSGWITPSNYVTSKIFKYTNTTYSASECELDVSNYTGTYYVAIMLHGWNAVVSDLKGTTVVENVTRHTYWNNAKWAQWNQVKELTQAEYNALTTAEKQNGNLYLTHDGSYDFFSYDNGKIIVRTNTTTGERIWYFNGFTKTADDMDVPSELVPYLPTQTQSGQVALTWAWTDDTSTTRNGAIGFLYPATENVKIRSWNNNYSQLYGGTFWGTLIIDDAGEQHNNYSAPTEGLSLLPNRIYFNGTKYAENSISGGGSSRITDLYTATGTTAPGTITLDDDPNNYDAIIIHIKSSVAGRATIGYTYLVSALANGDIIGGELAAGSGWIWYSYSTSTPTILTYVGVNQNYYVAKIAGMKF